MYTGTTFPKLTSKTKIALTKLQLLTKGNTDKFAYRSETYYVFKITARLT